MSPAKLRRLARSLPLAAAVTLFVLLAVHAAPALQAARDALTLCAEVIIPSLLPFFALSGLMSALGLASALSRPASGWMQRLFGVSGAGAAAFLIGLTGGYPLGAAAAAELYKSGEVSEDEARRLVCFCNNTGPAFILGAAGSGVFGSLRAGLVLYLSHALAAVLTGLCFRGKRRGESIRTAPSGCEKSLAAALPDAVYGAVKSTVLICGYVVLFSVLRGVLDALGLFSFLSGELALRTGLGLRASRALLTGLLELGSGIGTLAGVTGTAGEIALCAFILGWGGISVQFQTRAVLSGTPLASAPLMRSKLLHGLFSAALAFLLALVIM